MKPPFKPMTDHEWQKYTERNGYTEQEVDALSIIALLYDEGRCQPCIYKDDCVKFRKK